MKVLLVNGSPHKHGCTNRALEEVDKTLHEEGIGSEFTELAQNLSAAVWLVSNVSKRANVF